MTQTTLPTRETWCPDAARYDRGECGWPACGCPDNGPTDAEVSQLVKTQTTADRLAALAELQDGWDSYGGRKPDTTAMLIARTITSRPPSINPSGDGAIVLEWHEDGFDLELWIEPGAGRSRVFTNAE